VGGHAAILSGVSVTYPDTRRQDVFDDYFGTRVADPYRWLEEPDSDETRAWVDAQNALTQAWLDEVPARDRIRGRLTGLWDYERFGVPSREGSHYIYAHNDGLQNQPVILKARDIDAPGAILIDPNSLSEDGTTSVSSLSFSDDGRIVAYAVSTAGSDWLEWRVRDVASATDLEDVVRWSKFSSAAWLPDGSGFFYSRYDAPPPGEALSGVNKHHQVFFHRLGTDQRTDELVYARPDQPEWGFNPDVTEDGRFLVIVQWEGTHRENRVFLRDLTKADAPIVPFLDAFDASYTIVGNDGPLFYVLTDRDAGRGRLVAIPTGDADPSGWRTLIPEADGRDVLAHAVMIGDRFLTLWRTDAHEQLRVYGLGGTFERRIPLPTLGSIAAVSGRRRDGEAFYAFTSFVYPTTTFRYDPETGESAVFRRPDVAFDPADYEVSQLFYDSRDGTRIPMFIVHRTGMARDGRNATLLYGYGGFNISLTPAFSPATVGWLELGGIFAVANIRGGGEYGREWHEAGRRARKQNAFDDFIAAAEYLIRERYTSRERLAIHGASNGGLLVAAAMIQRPDLFAAVVPQVGVLDMLRFHKFTIGWAWTSDYGSSDTADGFETLRTYSPLHTIVPGTAYPAVMVITADHDDRVVPAHSHKFTAALQAAQHGPAPILARIETRAGHGAGKPTGKQIDERADMYAFLFRVLNMADSGSRPGSLEGPPLRT
jgi:prolyl oligopeptidase